MFNKHNMINLILFGPPGSGKGTQAQLLSAQYGLVHISTGDLFRGEMQAGTELGHKASEFMSRGELVPDEVTIGMLKNKMLEHADDTGFIFDGFPRTIPQAEALDQMLVDLDQQIDALIMLDVDEDEIVKRIVLRAQESNRTDDHDESIVRNRYQVYLEKTEPIYHYYDEQGKAWKIQGTGSIDDIFNNLCSLLDRLQA
jgi:adenylate kinase